MVAVGQDVLGVHTLGVRVWWSLCLGGRCAVLASVCVRALRGVRVICAMCAPVCAFRGIGVIWVLCVYVCVFAFRWCDLCSLCVCIQALVQSIQCACVRTQGQWCDLCSVSVLSEAVHVRVEQGWRNGLSPWLQHVSCSCLHV